MTAGTTREWNFDGLIGPTHFFAGLGPGNLASQRHRGQVSDPRAAALQGLAKMRQLHALGVPQGVLPPHPRPNVDLLRRMGFDGEDASVLSQARRHSPRLLSAACSASSMWTANAATVCPSADATDGKVHFTPANLISSLHRASETSLTGDILRSVFPASRGFVHHQPIPAAADAGDEGAANHTRFGDPSESAGVHFFVYGTEVGVAADQLPRHFSPRQSRVASESVVRLHELDPRRVVLARQHPAAIDAGVFHNDVIAVGHRWTLLCHQQAFADRRFVHDALRRATDGRIRIVEVTDEQLSLADAVTTYLFNSQIVTSGEDRTVLVAPRECGEHDGVWALTQRWVMDGWLDAVELVDVRESMANGGGPACLRLRVVLTADEASAITPGVVFDESLDAQLIAWIERHYRETLTAEEMADPSLLHECHAALDELTGLLGLGSIYPFQRTRAV